MRSRGQVGLFKKEKAEENTVQQFNYPLIIVEGAVVGLLTGLVGAGGGFLIIPALVLLSKLPMKQAVGTSLLIIAAKSLIGFTGDLGKQDMDGVSVHGWLTTFPLTDEEQTEAWFDTNGVLYFAKANGATTKRSRFQTGSLGEQYFTLPTGYKKTKF